VRIIQVDFNSRDEEGRVWLTLPCSQADIARFSAPLEEGDTVLLTDGEGFVRARVIRDGDHWLGLADWDTWLEEVMADRPVEVGQSRPVRDWAA